MPTYQYACTACGRQLEAVQSFSDDALTQCPECAGQLRKVFSAVGIVFKGSGFYRTDSRKGANGDVPAAGAKDGKSESKSDATSSSDSSSSGSSDSSSSSKTPTPSSGSSGSSGSSDSSGSSASSASSGSSGSSTSSSGSGGSKKATTAA